MLQLLLLPRQAVSQITTKQRPFTCRLLSTMPSIMERLLIKSGTLSSFCRPNQPGTPPAIHSASSAETGRPDGQPGGGQRQQELSLIILSFSRSAGPAQPGTPPTIHSVSNTETGRPDGRPGTGGGQRQQREGPLCLGRASLVSGSPLLFFPETPSCQKNKFGARGRRPGRR